MTRSRPQEDDELWTTFTRARDRLDDGLLRIDAGDSMGVDSVAVSLRLLTNGGQGDNLLRRVVAATGAAPLEVYATAGVPRQEAGLQFGFGALPVDPEENDGSALHGVADFLELQCLIVADGTDQVSYQWRSLLSVIASKLGPVHSDPKIPTAVDEISCYMLGDVPVLRYSLRAAGAQIARHCHQVTRHVDPSHLYEAPDLIERGQPCIGNAFVYGDLDTGLDIRVHMRIRSDSSVMSYQSPGRVDWLFNPPASALEGNPPPTHSTMIKGQRNKPCTCGSGSKYKHCCGGRSGVDPGYR